MNPTKEQLADPKWWNENAPEGATHYLPEDEDHFACWVKLGYTMKAGMKSKWVRDELESVVHLLIARPAPWNGEGLPPVGAVCEDDAGNQVVIVAHHANGVHAIFAESLDAGLLYYGAAGEFRPLRTPEQIAAEEREKAIIEISKILGCLWASEQEAAAYLYDNGYRKQEQTK